MALFSRNIPWRGLVAESIVVVLSILLAFTIDAWWESRKNDKQLHSMLQEVLDDLYAGKELLDFYKTMGLARKEASLKLLAVEGDAGELLSDEQGYRLVNSVGWFTERDIMPMGSVNALLSSGNVGQIRSAPLRRLISNLPTLIETASYNLNPEYDFAHNIWNPYISEKANWIQIAAFGDDHVPGHPNEPWPADKAPIGEPVPLSDLLNDREFRNLLYWNIENLNTSAFYYNSLAGTLDEAIELIKAEIDISN